MGNVAMLARRLILTRIEFVMLNLSFEFYTFFWAFDKQKFFIMKFLCLSMSVRFFTSLW